MKKCNNCGTKSCANNGKIGVPIGCNDYTPPMPQTNADRIRQMSDEELAEWVTTKGRTFGEEYEGYMSALDWLKSPVEVDNG